MCTFVRLFYLGADMLSGCGTAHARCGHVGSGRGLALPR